MTEMASNDRASLPHSRDAGFSLVEVLVTLALVSILSGILIASLGQFRSIISLTNRNDASVEVDALANYLANSLGNMRLLPILSEHTSERPTLVGTMNTLRFIGVDRIGSQDHALREIRFFTRINQDGILELMQSSSSRRVAPADRSLVTTLAETDHVAFNYMGSGDWQEEWKDSRPPSAVRITISIKRNGQSVSATRTIMLPDLI